MTNAFPDLLFVFEMANNHQGDVEHGARIISEMGQIAARHGVRAAVKLQYRDLDTFIHPDFVGRAARSPSSTSWGLVRRPPRPAVRVRPREGPRPSPSRTRSAGCRASSG